MEQYKQEFIEFMVDSQVLKFGEFTLKSGRKSPFFMNAGGYVTPVALVPWNSRSCHIIIHSAIQFYFSGHFCPVRVIHSAIDFSPAVSTG